MNLKYPEVSKNYRKDINGLRALAVLLVLIYHIDTSWLNAGFLGVDIFLVISGYLITRNIVFEISQNSFSFKIFYLKRIRRLFPVLGVVMLVTLIAGYFILPPYFYSRLGQATLSAVFSLSNFFFWFEDGYFNVGSYLKPLLHTWSLGLEEQFYLIWPPIIYLIYKLKWKLSLVMVTTFLFSILSAEFNTDDSASFFLLPFRMFEFLAGAFIIFIEQHLRKSPNWLNTILHIMGISLVVGSAIYFDKYTDMPSLISMVPCLGTMIIIAFPPSFLSKMLFNNTLSSILGKSSYSIYLVHWPIIVYYNFLYPSNQNIEAKLFIAALCIIIGLICWSWIEKPFKTIEYNNWKIVFGIPSFFLLLGLASYGIDAFDGFKTTDKNPYSLSRENMTSQRQKYWVDGRNPSGILLGDTNKKIVIMGNSHSVDLIYALRNNGFKHQIEYLRGSHYCFNFGSSSVQSKNKKDCSSELNKHLSSPVWKTADAIYLHDDWKGTNLVDLKNLLLKIRNQTNAPIFVFGPKMVYTRFADVILSSCTQYDPASINAQSQKFIVKTKEDQNDQLLNFFSNPEIINQNIQYVDIQGSLKKHELVSSKTGKLLYFDSNHYTEAGSTELGERLKIRYPILFE